MIAKEKAQELFEHYSFMNVGDKIVVKEAICNLIDHIKDELSLFYNSIYTNDETYDIYEDTLQWWEDVRKEVEKL